MSKEKKSGSAIFMYCMIAATIAIAAICFLLYYVRIVESKVILWTGVASFTILYHFWLRIIMGNVTRLLTIHHGQFWFKEHGFEKGLYKLLRVRRWKDKVLTYDPAAFSMEKHSLEEIANTMCKAETDHWINELISLSTMLFAFPWGAFWLFFGTALVGMLFDAQFIVVQRFNRPILLKTMERQKARAQRRAKKDAEGG